jgi:excisionase family DNA binding protein
VYWRHLGAKSPESAVCGIGERQDNGCNKAVAGAGSELLTGAGNQQAFETDDLDTTEAEAMEAHDDDTLLTPSEVAAMFRVNPKTVTRWARAGKISAIRTLGGHRRFRASEIRHFLENVEESDRI